MTGFWPPSDETARNIPEPTASNPDVTDAVFQETDLPGVLTVKYVNGAGLETFSLRTSLHFAETISMVMAIVERFNIERPKGAM